MCFFHLWRKKRDYVNIKTPIIVISPIVRQTILNTPIIPKNCDYCDKPIFNKKQTYHIECYHSAIFAKNKKLDEKIKQSTNSF